jgi:hypothetical protein
VDNLTLDFEIPDDDDDDDDDSGPTMGIAYFIGRFENLTFLGLGGGSVLSSLTDTNHPPFTGLMKLHISLIEDLDSMPLRPLARLFPNVEKLELNGLSFTLDDSHDAIWPMLKSLTVGDAEIMPWKHMQFPDLASLRIVTFNSNPEDLISFITGHSSLRHLTFLNQAEELPNLVDQLARLETLTVDCLERLGNPSSIRLHGVKDLRVRIWDSKRLTPTLVENIIKYHFRKTASSSSGVNFEQSSAMLRIMVPRFTKEEDLAWLNSEPFILESVTEVESSDLVYKSFNLKLVNP